LLKTLGIQDLPPLAIQQDKIVYPEPVVSTIVHLFQKYHIKTKNVALALTGSSVSIKKIAVPRVPADELADMVRWEADQYLPFDSAEAYIDFQLLPSPSQGNTLNLLLIGAKKERVQALIKVAKQAGLKPVIIDSSALALENQCEVNYRAYEHDVVALVDIGASIITVNILENGSTIFVSSALGGGNDLSQAIQDEFNINQEQADRIKHGKQLIDVDIARLRKIVQQASEQIVAQIEHLFSCFSASHPGKVVSQVLLSGGGALLRGFPGFIARRLNRPVEIANPLKEVACNGEKYSPGELSHLAPLIAVGMGLALRRPGDKVYRPVVNR
jgi:type IV pilus assembly protein PilM